MYESTCGAAPVTLVALPGLGGNAWSFPEAMFDGVRSMGVTVVCMSYGTDVTTVVEMAKSSWDKLRDIGVALHPGSVVLLGYSMGGFVAQEMTTLHRDWVSGVVFLATACAQRSNILVSPKVLQDAVSRRIRRSHKYAPKKAVVGRGTFIREMLAVFGFVLVSNSCSKLKKINVPVLILHGEQDDVLPVNNATRLQSNLHNAVVTFVAVPDTTHALPFEQTAYVSDILALWLVKASIVTPPPRPQCPALPSLPPALQYAFR